MRLNLEYINKIKKADIQLNGLTVIAGENDTGKSTVGKVLFSIVKALSNALNYDEQQKGSAINKNVTSIYRRLNGLTIRRNNGIEISKDLFPRSSMEFYKSLLDADDQLLFIEDRRAYIGSLDITPRQKALLNQDLDNIAICMKTDSNPAAVLRQEMQSFIEAEFLNRICTTDCNQQSKLEFYSDLEDKVVEATLMNDVVTSVKCFSSIDGVWQDATYVESPLYIHLVDVLSTSLTFREVEHKRHLLRPMVPLHIKDLAEKIDAIRFVNIDQHSLFDEDSLFDMDKLTGGHFVYDSKTRGAYWQKAGTLYSPVNVASGIKAFGIVQILLETHAIDENKLLLWDEPENHLHPQWQIAFAQLLVELAKAGISIVVSSHSPYFIQGIRYFAAKTAMEKYVNYYLAEEVEGDLVEMQNVSNDLNRVFTKLAQPMNSIMNLED